MWFSTQTSPGTRVSLAYITIGSLIVVWTGVWFWYLWENPPETGTVYYYSVGTLVTGLVLLVIGFGVGAIARGSRRADAGAEAPASTIETPVSPVVTVAPAPAARMPGDTVPAVPAPAPTQPVGRR